MTKFSYYEPPGMDQPEVCHCGHYSYRHGEYGCRNYARPGFSWRGRLSWSILGATFSIAMRCPCMRAWRGGELLDVEVWE